MTFSPAARTLLESNAPATLVTINPDGSPQVALVWVGLDGDEIVAAHLDPNQKKLRNMRGDPRVAVSVVAPTLNDRGLNEYLVVRGTARLTEGGAADLLQRLAHVYLGPNVRFPPMDDPPPGIITHIAVEWLGGVGDWTA